jgi:hypothetical protein
VRTTSTSFITGTGLKKWRPTKRSGRPVAMASWVMVSDEVFEAKIALLLDHLVRLRKVALLLVQVLDDRLDHQVAVRQVGEVDGAGEAPERRVAGRGLELALLHRLVERAADAAEPLLEQRGSTSRTTTSNPAFAATSAMPEPIRPQPSTPTLRIAIVASLSWNRSSSFRRAGQPRSPSPLRSSRSEPRVARRARSPAATLPAPRKAGARATPPP